ncbi:hypothetical protein HMPREF1043_1275 [Streptococcus anginosus subsp. whileyi CCUG 39159]|uniref:Uncharacterized protein n=1 Tax=Streptococcus anginosus subsp. whileyi CCUG 39159 TaxID=1095729 RepID=I0SI15_STRAP|nr:hypothetical protein HMPREF1043_1275 [Streptococcus anginosus subsp. whileyi CCUG 39159]
MSFFVALYFTIYQTKYFFIKKISNNIIDYDYFSMLVCSFNILK